MKKKLALGAGLLLALLLTPHLLARRAESLHLQVIQQIEATGFAQLDRDEFQRGWLSSRAAGEMRLNLGRCAPCPRLSYTGRLEQAPIPTRRESASALSFAEYRLAVSWPGLSPALPGLVLRASRPLAGVTTVDFTLPASRHAFRPLAETYQIEQGGLRGSLRGGKVQTTAPLLSFGRKAKPWLRAESITLTASRVPELELTGSAASLGLPELRWQGHDIALHWRHNATPRQLDLDIQVTARGGQLGEREHGATGATVAAQGLNLPALRALWRDSRGLANPRLPPGLRALGWINLQRNHGPAFFATTPGFKLHSQEFPVPEGYARADIELQVVAGLRQAPLTPDQWRQAIRADVLVSAPAPRLQIWLDLVMPTVAPFLGLPTAYQDLKERGWVHTLADGRDQFALRIDAGQLLKRPDSGA